MRRLLGSSVIMLVLLVAASLVSPAVNAYGYTRHRKYKPPPPMAKLAVTVLKAEDGTPLQNAAVVFHLTRQGSGNEGNMELKTNEQGKATLTIVPVGSTVLVQVIAQGYRTFGRTYDVPTSQRSITIKMLPPDQQYSIYSKYNPNTDVQNNAPHTQMGHAAPTDSPLLTPPPKSN